MLNFVTGTIFSAVIPLLAALGLLFLTASATLELKRNEAGVDAMLHRHALFGSLNVERLELSGLLKAESISDKWVALTTDQGFIRATRSPLDKSQASQGAEHINVFLEDASQDSLVVVLGTRLGLAKAFGYIFLSLILLTVAYLLLPGKSPPQES